MTQLNTVGTALGQDPRVHAITDVTGGVRGARLPLCAVAPLPPGTCPRLPASTPLLHSPPCLILRLHLRPTPDFLLGKIKQHPSSPSPHPHLPLILPPSGFGLLGHLLEVCRGSGLAARVAAGAVPVMAPALALAQRGVFPGAVERNWDSYGAAVAVEQGVEVGRAGGRGG